MKCFKDFSMTSNHERLMDGKNLKCLLYRSDIVLLDTSLSGVGDTLTSKRFLLARTSKL